MIEKNPLTNKLSITGPSLRTIEITKTATSSTESTVTLIGDIAVSQSKESKTLNKYIGNVGAMNKQTGIRISS
jgi:hypothetical protein